METVAAELAIEFTEKRLSDIGNRGNPIVAFALSGHVGCGRLPSQSATRGTA